MNILILSWRGPKHPHAGGAELSTLEHSKGWVNNGHKVTLFTSSFDSAKPNENIDGINIIRKGNQILGVHLKAMIWYLFGDHPKFDIVVDEVHGIPFFTPLYVRVPKLVFIHEVAKEVWRLNPWRKPFNILPAIIGTIFEPLMFRILYRTIPFMTVSESTREDLINWKIPKTNITIVSNGFRNPNFPKGKKESTKTIIYLGALSKDKGIEDALDTFSILYKKKRKTMNFWVVGNGESRYLEFIKRKTKLLGINKVVTFFGFVGEKEKYNLLSRAHVLVNPSVREGWGFVVIEAASVGTPTVAYNVAGLRDSVVNGKTGLLCEPNPVACAEKINYLLKDEILYLSLSKNCLNWCRKFSWSDSVNKSTRLLEKIAKAKY